MARRRGRIDNTQPDIVKALRKIGASVVSLANMGNGVPDLLIGYHGRTFLIEVKSPRNKANDPQDLTTDEQQFHLDWRGAVIGVCVTPDDALEFIQQQGNKQR